MVTVGVLIRIEAQTGKEDEVSSLLAEALPLAQEESGTTAWFASRLGRSTFWLFNAFPDDTARRDHLAGPIAEALAERAEDLFSEPPVIEQTEILAAKLPH